ncbi:PglZ domain-containing protein [Streptomyces sp. NRRL WC-3744]|uniref:PglZ domain-containing protein n=1 Tax=Streptomyces sp. NRRL WC-3744 TaxID=1463935 RepID=UPI0004C78F5F|nr:PglZ domain-containing protein [Streptomyces sp. NRRL WC-3744]
MTSPITIATWHTMLGDISMMTGEFLLYIDPHGLDSIHSSHGETAVIVDRWSLRRILEQRLHLYKATDPPLLIHLRIPGLASIEDLPFDARHYARRVLDVRLPSGALEDVYGLPARAVEQLTANRGLPERLAAVARELSGLSWPPTTETAIITVARLLPHMGPGLRALLVPSCPPGTAARILRSEDPLEALSDVLAEWARMGSSHPEDAALRAAAEEISQLVTDGQVRPPAGQLPPSMPKVLREVVREIDALPQVERLLHALPDAGVDLDSWALIADQWANLRWTLAALPPTPSTAELADAVWKRWEDLNSAWQGWLDAQYAVLLSRNVLRLASVHRIAPFLASHVVDAGSKFLLLVMDGLGVAQWQQIVSNLALSPIEDRRVLACLPTMTTVSRQAIFAGELPINFAGTVDRTDTEPARWRAFWTKHGLTSDEVYYQRTAGSDAAAWQDPPAGAVVSGVAVNAIDDLMHGVSVNGDHQFYACVKTWLTGGFLERALDWANRSSAQVWITADHGNLPCVALGETIPNEGVRVIGRGLRSRVYATQLQRDSSALSGKRWTPPGFPAQAGAPLFALGRTHFRRSGGVITHGGLSLDEVIVPLSRIA